MVLQTGGSLSLSSVKSEFYPDDNPVNSYNWYNNITYGANWNNNDAAYTPVISGSDPTKQIQMTDNGTYRYPYINFPNINYQNTEQFTFTFEMNVNGGTGDYLNFNFGSCYFNFVAYTGYGMQGVNFYDCTGNIAVRATDLSWNVNSWVRVMIVYNKGCIDTWNLYINGKKIISYSDSNNARFLSTTDNTMKIKGFNGAATFISYLRKFDLKQGLPYTIVDPYTWYTDMSYTNLAGTFTPVQSGSDPNVQVQLSNNTSTNNLQMLSYYNEFPVHKNSFSLTFQFNIGNGNANDFFVNFGQKSPLETDISLGNCWRIIGGTVSGLQLVGPGSNTPVATGSITWTKNAWYTLVITYTKGISETWRISCNNNEFIKYSDLANQKWIDGADQINNSGNYWGIGSSSNTHYFYIRQVNMVVLPSSSSNSQKLLTPLNWYTTLTSDIRGTVELSDPIKLAPLVTGTANTDGVMSMYINMNSYNSLCFAYEVYHGTGGDYFSIRIENIIISFMLWSGYSNGGFSGAGVYVIKANTGVAVAYSSNITFLYNAFTPIQVIYNNSTTNTFIISYNGNVVLTYSDSISWPDSAYFEIRAHSGIGLQLWLACRRLQLSYVPKAISLSGLIGTGGISIGSGVQNSTSGGMLLSSLYNKQAAVLTNNSQLAIDTGSWSNNIYMSDASTRWLWNTYGSTGGSTTPGDILVKFQTTYTNTSTNPISAILNVGCDDGCKVYQNKALIAPMKGGWANVLQFPPSALTSNSTAITGYGTYIASASAQTVNEPVYRAFDNNTGTYWGELSTYNSSGNYTGSVSTTVSGVAYTGEWIQLQTPTSQPLVTFSLAGRQDQSLYLYRSPNTIVVAGSNDGSTWTLIDSRSGIQTSTGYANFNTNQNNLNSYTYFRLIVRTIGNSTAAGPGGSWIDISEWNLFTLNNPIPVIIQPGPNVFDFVGYNANHNNPAGIYFNCLSTSGVLFRSDNNSATALTNSSKTTFDTVNRGSILPLNSLRKSYTCNGAYALVYVNFSYTGPVVSIRASGGPNSGTTADFYVDSRGNLMQNSVSRYNTLPAFLGGGTGYVTIWYDQTGNGRHATQSTAAYQPIIAWNTTENAWCVDTQNSSSQYLNLPTGTIPVGTLNAPYSMFVKHGILRRTNYGGLVSGGLNSTNQLNEVFYDNRTTNYWNAWFANDVAFGTLNTSGNMIGVTYDGANRRTYVNNTLTNTVVSTGGTTSSAGNQYIGYSLNAGYMNGQIYHCYIFSTNIGNYSSGSEALNAIQDTTALTALHNTMTLSKSNSYGTCLTTVPVLDTISSTSKSSCNGAYALVRLSMNYTGATVNIRRSSDNSTSDFYADIAGNLNTAINGSGTSFENWLQGSIAYVVTWYDQSGKGNNATQSTAAYQPIINIATNAPYTENVYYVDTQNSGAQFFNIPSGTVPTGTLNAPYSFVLRHGNTNNISTGTMIASGAFATNQCNTLRFGNDTNNAYTNYWYANDITFGTSNQNGGGNQVAVTYNGSTQNCYINNTLVKSVAHTGATTAAGQQYLFRNVAGAEYFNGQMYYCYIFSNSIPDADRLKLTTV
jgi:hypothetical protein